jgi:hypothetical protein
MSESEPRLIHGYLEALAAQLPASIVDELADGLAETHRSYLGRGLSCDAAAEAAVEEFGSAEEILAGFARVNPARRAARRLLGLGPVVGLCWVAALMTSRVWPGPLPARVGVGLALLASIGLLAVAALGRRYRVSVLSGMAGFAGFAALDTALIVGVVVLVGSLTWVTALAMAGSLLRVALCARALRPAIAGWLGLAGWREPLVCASVLSNLYV